jgi:hypothetical protein
LKQWELSKPKGGISRTIEIGDTIVSILKQVRVEQYENRMFFGKNSGKIITRESQWME